MKLEDFGPFKLSAGNHAGPDYGMCVMEMVGFLNGEKWSDHPQCASPVLTKFCQRINDRFGQAQRDQLQQLVPMLINTRSDEHDLARVEVLVWGAIRKFAPFYLRIAGLESHAARLEKFAGSLAEAQTACRDAAADADADASGVGGVGAYACVGAARGAARAGFAAAGSAGAACTAAADADAGEADAEIFPSVLEVLREAIEIGPHGTAYTDIHLERGAQLKQLMETTQ